MSSSSQTNPNLVAVIGKYNFLIADPTSSRKSIRTLLIQLGIKPSQFHVVESISEAEETIAAKKTQIIFADEAIAGDRVIDLLKLQQSSVNLGEATAFFLLTSKNSNAQASNAAEDDLDAVLIKPFTFEQLKNDVTDALTRKFQPTPFHQAIEKGKSLLSKGQDNDALKEFLSAQKLEPSSALPYSYSGTILTKLGKLDEAKKAFNEGLKLNPTHYKCHLGLLELLVLEKNYSEGYKIARSLVEHHPVPLRRLPDLIRLSIWNKKFQDVLEFYQVADGVSQVDQTVSKYMAAGLAVCGLYFIQIQNQTAAIDAFRKAEVISKNDPKILTRILSALITAGLERETKTFLTRASDEVKDSIDLKLAKIDFHLKKTESHQALELANQYIKEGVKDVKIFKVAIQCSIEIKRKKQVIEELIDEAGLHFPDLKSEFLKIVPKDYGKT